MKRKQSTEQTKLQKQRERILIIAVLLCAGVLWLGGEFFQNSGIWVVVETDGEVTNRFLLSEDTDFMIYGEDGGVNRLIITEHTAYILSANCSNQTCVHSMPISKEGQSIVCLPNRVHVYVESTSKQEVSYDAITN